jgi:hypothetical protein
MKICYEVTIDDLVEFGIYYCDTSPTVRRTKNLFLCGAPLLLLAVAVLSLFILILSDELDDEILVQVILGSLFYTIVFSVLWIVIWPNRFQQSLARRYRKLCSEGSVTEAVGFKELELTENGFGGKEFNQRI